MRKLLITTALLTALAAPSHANNTAVIVIDRDFNLHYPASIFTVTLDTKEQCNLADGDDCAIGTAPGKHVLEIAVSHWLKADEHYTQQVTLRAGERLKVETGYGCDHWVQVSPQIIGSCAGRMYVDMHSEHAENAKGTPGY